ncbi:tungsten formylmethanofuran dehydrogenase [Bacillus cereus]|nr:tungsten formylmethanofuran dehydrogenase [Bacillus cereus]
MKRKLVALAIPILLVTTLGVGCSVKEKQVDPKVSIEQNKKEDYKENLAYLMKDLSEQSKVVSDVLTSNKSVEEKQKEFETASKDLLDTATKLKHLQPSDKYKEVQDKVETAMGLLNMSVLSIKDGFEQKDGNLMNIGNDAIIKASKKINEANKMMEEIK